MHAFHHVHYLMIGIKVQHFNLALFYLFNPFFYFNKLVRFDIVKNLHFTCNGPGYG